MLLKLEGAGPLYTRVYATLRRQIVEGRFAAGKRLPGTRTVADALGVSRTVVLHAYAQLEAEGYTATRVGSGTYVVDAVPVTERLAPAHAEENRERATVGAEEARPPEVPTSRLAGRVHGAPPTDLPRELLDDVVGIVNLTDGAVSYDVRGLKAWRQVLTQAMDSLPTDPPEVAGARPLREALLDYLLRERGVVANIDDVFIVNSAQQARDLIARVLVDEGTVVGVEDPCHPGVRRAFGALGARVEACALDDDGLDITAQAPVLVNARVLHVAPTCHLPTGATLSQARREALLAWAYAQPAWIVEEDVDCDHRHGVRTLPSLASMDRHERVIYYMSGFAHTVYPAMEMSCVVVPSALREKFHALKALSDRDGLALRQYAWANYVAAGEYRRSQRRLTQQLLRKHEMLIEALQQALGADIRIEGKAVAGQVLAHLPSLDAAWMSLLREEALRLGLLLQSAEDWYCHRPDHVVLLLHYAAVPEAMLVPAAQRLALAYRHVQADVGRSRRRRA